MAAKTHPSSVKSDKSMPSREDLSDRFDTRRSEREERQIGRKVAPTKDAWRKREGAKGKPVGPVDRRELIMPERPFLPDVDMRLMEAAKARREARLAFVQKRPEHSESQLDALQSFWMKEPAQVKGLETALSAQDQVSHGDIVCIPQFPELGLWAAIWDNSAWRLFQVAKYWECPFGSPLETDEQPAQKLPYNVPLRAHPAFAEFLVHPLMLLRTPDAFLQGWFRRAGWLKPTEIDAVLDAADALFRLSSEKRLMQLTPGQATQEYWDQDMLREVQLDLQSLIAIWCATHDVIDM